MRKILALFIVVICLFSFSSCKKINEYDDSVINSEHLEAVNYPVTVEDVVYNKAPEKVVSLSPAVTDMMISYGLEDKLVGISEYCTAPEGSNAKVVGSPAKPDMMTIISLEPDIVITQSPLALSDVNALKDKGITLLYKPVPQSVAEFVDYYAMISLLFFGNSYYSDKTTEVLNDFDTALSGTSTLGKDRTFVFIETDFMAVATGDTLGGDLLTAFGNNIAQDKTNHIMSSDEIVEADPDIIFLGEGIDEDKLPDNIKQLSAYTDNRIVYIDMSVVENPTTRLTDVIDNVVKSLNEIKDANTEETE